MSVLNASVLILTTHDLVGGTNALLLLMILNNMVTFNIILIRSPNILDKEKFYKGNNKDKNIILKAPKIYFNFGSYGSSWTCLFWLTIISPALEQYLTCGRFSQYAKVMSIIYL